MAAVPIEARRTNWVRTPPSPDAATKFAGTTPPGNEAVNVIESKNVTP